MENIGTQYTFKAGPLKKTKFSTEQERVDAFTEAIIGTVQAGPPGTPGASISGSPGPRGEKGDSVALVKKTVSIASGVSFVIAQDSLEDSTVKLVNNVEPGTISITSINGATAYFSGVTATANYKLVYTKYEIT